MSFNSDIQKLSVDGMVTLFELDATKLGAGVLRFHGHNHDKNDGNIIFRGQEYSPQALSVTGLEMRSDGRASTPTLTLANNIGGVQGAVSAYCLQFNDFANARLSTKTLLLWLIVCLKKRLSQDKSHKICLMHLLVLLITLVLAICQNQVSFAILKLGTNNKQVMRS